jgi:hypothetical protein
MFTHIVKAGQLQYGQRTTATVSTQFAVYRDVFKPIVVVCFFGAIHSSMG